MSTGVSADFYNGRSQVDQKSSWVPPVPASDSVLGTGISGTGAGQSSPNGSQSSYQSAAQQSTPGQQSPAVPDDGQYHPNQYSSVDKAVPSNTENQQGAKGLDSTSPQVGPGQQTTGWQQGTSQGGEKPPGIQAKPSPLPSSRPGQNQDNGQYHPDLISNGHSGQANPAQQQTGNQVQQQAGNQVQPNQQAAPAQHGSNMQTGSQFQQNQQAAPAQQGANMQADQMDQSSWNQATPTTNDWNSQAISAQSATPTEKEPQHTTSAEASTSTPSIPASQASNSPATSAAASAGIALAVAAALAFIAIIVLLPLYKKRKRLRKLLAQNEKVIIMEQPPRRRMQPVNEFMARSYSRSHHLVRSATGYFKSKPQAPLHFVQASRAPSSSSHTSSNREKAQTTVTAVRAPHSTPSTLHGSPPASFATWSTERSKSSSNSSVAPSHEERQLESPTSNLGQFYGLGSAENLSMGNLVAVNPLMNKIYSVEMDYNSGKPGQLVLRVGQRLTILQVYDHGWVRVLRFHNFYDTC